MGTACVSDGSQPKSTAICVYYKWDQELSGRTIPIPMLMLNQQPKTQNQELSGRTIAMNRISLVKYALQIIP